MFYLDVILYSFALMAGAAFISVAAMQIAHGFQSFLINPKNLSESHLQADPDVIAILVHGTFARNAAWARPGSMLSAKLETLGDRVLFDALVWRGWNTLRSRRKGVSDLIRRLRYYRRAYPDVPVFVLGHSHGGSIAWSALRCLGRKHNVAGLVCISTPFLVAQPVPQLRSLDSWIALLKERSERLSRSIPKIFLVTSALMFVIAWLAAVGSFLLPISLREYVIYGAFIAMFISLIVFFAVFSDGFIMLLRSLAAVAFFSFLPFLAILGVVGFGPGFALAMCSFYITAEVAPIGRSVIMQIDLPIELATIFHSGLLSNETAINELHAWLETTIADCGHRKHLPGAIASPSLPSRS